MDGLLRRVGADPLSVGERLTGASRVASPWSRLEPGGLAKRRWEEARAGAEGTRYASGGERGAGQA